MRIRVGTLYSSGLIYLFQPGYGVMFDQSSAGAYRARWVGLVVAMTNSDESSPK